VVPLVDVLFDTEGAGVGDGGAAISIIIVWGISSLPNLSIDLI